MSKEVFRRCGCRDENGKQFGNTCPTLTTDAKHGTWSYSASAGTNPRTGKRQQLRGGGYTTKREAQRELLAARTKAVTGRMPTDSNTTVAEYLETWLERREVDGLRPSTLVMYRSYVRNDIIPALGRLKLAKLRRTDVDQFIRGLSSETRGATTVHRIYSALSSAMSTAVQLHLIDSSPATNVRLPKRAKFRAVSWEPEQASQFLAEVRPFRLGVLYEVAIRTGLRRGEVCGLRWQDVSFTDKELVVRVQLVEVAGAAVEGEIKTKSGQDRIVALDDALVDALAAWKLFQDEEREAWGSGYQDSGRVFTYEDGRELRPRYVARYFDTYTEKAGLPKIRFHDLRHLHASLLINAGIPLAVVSKRLGHSTIAVTVDLYGHLMRDANRDAAEAAAAMLAPKEPSAHTLHTQPLRE